MVSLAGVTWYIRSKPDVSAIDPTRLLIGLTLMVASRKVTGSFSIHHSSKGGRGAKVAAAARTDIPQLTVNRH